MSTLFPPALLAQAQALLAAYRAQGRSLAAAESCTGGLLLGCLTEIPGCSDVVLGGFVTYANRQKEALGVPATLLGAYGAVSSEVAAAMAAATRATTRASVALSITGIAGPDGGTVDKPVGTVWFGRADAGGVVTERLVFAGNRTVIRLAAVAEGLRILHSALTGDRN